MMENTCCDITDLIVAREKYALKNFSPQREEQEQSSALADSLWIQLKALNTKWFESNCKRMLDD